MIRKLKYPIIILLIILIISLLVILFSRISQQNDEKSTTNNNYAVTIDNINNFYPDLPDNIKTIIIKLAHEMITNINQPSNTATLYKANVNPDYPHTLQYDAGTSLYLGEFILDIPTIQQSYQVSFSYPQDQSISIANPVDITCPSSNYQIYKNFQCQDMGQH